jgi:hypothetical protein
MMIIELVLTPFIVVFNLMSFWRPKSYLQLDKSERLAGLGGVEGNVYFGYGAYRRWLPRAKYVEGYFKSLSDAADQP